MLFHELLGWIHAFLNGSKSYVMGLDFQEVVPWATFECCRVDAISEQSKQISEKSKQSSEKSKQISEESLQISE